jgi:hypothetical protein
MPQSFKMNTHTHTRSCKNIKIPPPKLWTSIKVALPFHDTILVENVGLHTFWETEKSLSTNLEEEKSPGMCER